MNKFRLADMTFREFQQRIGENPVILLPLGSQEEQGPTALDVTDLTDNGIISGDPDLVSAAAGQHVVEHIVSIAAKFVRAFRDALLQAATRSGGHA